MAKIILTTMPAKTIMSNVFEFLSISIPLAVRANGESFNIGIRNLSTHVKETPMDSANSAQNDTQIKLGKMMFYITCAVSLWFFYWFAGIQCPC